MGTDNENAPKLWSPKAINHRPFITQSHVLVNLSFLVPEAVWLLPVGLMLHSATSMACFPEDCKVPGGGCQSQSLSALEGDEPEGLSRGPGLGWAWPCLALGYLPH